MCKIFMVSIFCSAVGIVLYFLIWKNKELFEKQNYVMTDDQFDRINIILFKIGEEKVPYYLKCSVDKIIKNKKFMPESLADEIIYYLNIELLNTNEESRESIKNDHYE